MKKIKYLLFILVVLSAIPKAYSQLNPLGSQYFQNQYLGNPAMAGIIEDWELNGAYKQQWSSIEGAPSMQSVTATYGSPNKKSGLGINFYNEHAGIIKRTSLKATYAFHLPLNSGTNFIDFGLSMGGTDEWIDLSQIRGDQADLSLSNFNQRKTYLDGDFGIAYRNQHLIVQGALPNLKRLFNRDIQRNVVDRSLYMGAVSYRIINNSSALTAIEPKVVYRGVENYKDILDAGLNTEFFDSKFMLSGMYHSTGSVTIGAGTTYKGKLSIMTQYTSNTADLQGYANGEFEIGLKFNFGRK